MMLGKIWRETACNASLEVRHRINGRTQLIVRFGVIHICLSLTERQIKLLCSTLLSEKLTLQMGGVMAHLKPVETKIGYLDQDSVGAEEL